jgi:hypothetical protein
MAVAVAGAEKQARKSVECLERHPGPPAAPGAAAGAHADENETITVPEVKDRQIVRDPRHPHCA